MTGSSSDAWQELGRWEPASAVGRFSLWEEEEKKRRRWGAAGWGTPPQHPGQGGAVPGFGGTAAKRERDDLSLGFLLSSEKERVKVNLRLT